MKLEKAIKNFVEKYDRTVMEYIEKISNDFGLVYSKQTIPSFNMKLAFEKFTEYIEGYADYKIRTLNEETPGLSQDEITETTKKWCEKLFNSDEICKNSDLTYDKIPEFIECYITEIKSLITTVEANKNRLMSENVDLKSVGMISEYADIFMDNLVPRFECVIDKVLLASGYVSAQRLALNQCQVKKDNEDAKNADNENYVLESSIFSEAFKLKKRNRITPSMKKRVKRTPSEVEKLRRERFEKTRGLKIFKSHNNKEEDKKIEEQAKRIAKKIFNETAVPTIALTLGKVYKTDDPKSRNDTKIGGIPYWPKSMKWPVDKHADPMLCIAQLNFDKLPKLDGYPTTGLLQIFINHFEYSGDFCSKAVYHKTYNSTDLLDDVPRSTLPEHADIETKYDGAVCFEGVFYPKAKLTKVGIEIFCEYSIDGKFNRVSYDDYVLKYANEEFGMDWKKISEVPDELNSAIYHAYISIQKSQGSYGCSRIGGWPDIIQSDPRDKNHSVPLLMLASEGEMMWGDMGNAYFFINKKENLTKKNVNDVLYDWDCC